MRKSFTVRDSLDRKMQEPIFLDESIAKSD
jgi:hypothetical protein